VPVWRNILVEELVSKSESERTAETKIKNDLFVTGLKINMARPIKCEPSLENKH
jgi:hypothetical protein